MRRARTAALGLGLGLGPALLFLGTVFVGRYSREVDGPASLAWPALGFVLTWLVGAGLVVWFLAESRRARTALEAELMAREQEQQRDLLMFSRRAAHDLQNPLTVVEGWAGELAGCLRDDPFAASAGAPAMVERIQAASERMRTLVSDLLADATARDRAVRPTSVDLTELAQEVAAWHPAAEITVNEIGVVQGDASMLRQVLENVVGNAVKYVAPDARREVTISGRRADDKVVMLVADRGIGIPSGLHETVFNEFERAHADAYPGTGLGLSICRRIVERHGGSIRAFDRDDGPAGTVLEIVLPASRSAGVAPHHALSLRYSSRSRTTTEVEA